jgi:hypothetical protein
MVGNFGVDVEGLHTFSVNTTTKQEILDIIKATEEAGAKYYEKPNITFKAKTYHALLQFQVPEGFKGEI